MRRHGLCICHLRLDDRSCGRENANYNIHTGYYQHLGHRLRLQTLDASGCPARTRLAPLSLPMGLLRACAPTLIFGPGTDVNPLVSST